MHESIRVRTQRQGIGLMALGIAWCFCSLAGNAEDLLHPSLRVCATLSEDAERLACYDRAIEVLASGAAAESPPPTPEEMFGMDAQLSREKQSANGVKREELPEITTRVTALHGPADGPVLIELDNGQLWQQVDEKRALVLRVGDTVRIARGAMGTFRVITSGQRSARVKRVR